ncbi:MAG: hypothetical protein RIQ93_1252 [Verrucomicrobiota bacterium]|jgi:hypothetical protein
MLTADTTGTIGAGSQDTGEPKTPPHVRLRKAAHDTILAYPVPRMRTAMLAVYVALLRAENDARAAHGEDFTVSVAEVARLAGMSVRSVPRFLPALVQAGLLLIPISGRNAHTENTYRLLSPDRPRRRALASAPASLAEVEAYLVSKGWDVPAETSREFFAYNEARQWMIPGATGKRFNPCRDWRKLLVGWVETHRTAPPAQPPPPDPAAPAAATQPRRGTTRTPQQSILITAMGEPLGGRAEVLCNIMRRDPRVPWRHEEFEALRCTGIATSPEFQFNEDTEALAWYYRRFEKGYWVNNERVDYRRQSMLALLLNWADEVMKAKRAFDSYLDEKRRSGAGRLYSTNEPEVTTPAYPSAPS